MVPPDQQASLIIHSKLNQTHTVCNTHAQRTPRNSTNKQYSTDTQRAQQTSCRCSESPVFICQPPDELGRQSDAFRVIYKPQNTQSATCAFTRMRTNQPKREERQQLLCGVAVYVPTKLTLATSRAVTSKQTPSCTKSKNEGQCNNNTSKYKPLTTPVQAD